MPTVGLDEPLSLTRASLLATNVSTAGGIPDQLGGFVSLQTEINTPDTRRQIISQPAVQSVSLTLPELPHCFYSSLQDPPNFDDILGDSTLFVGS